MRREMKYRARVKFRSEHDLSKETRAALKEAQMKFLELGASPIVNGIQYKTESEEDVLGFKAAAEIIIRELVKELDYSHIEIEIETSPQYRCGYEARIDDENCSHCGEELNRKFIK